MFTAVRGAWALLVGVALLMLGMGLMGTLLGLRATFAGFSVPTTGLVMSAYYVGFILGSWATPNLVSGVGPIRVFAALASLASVTALVHGLFVNPPMWFAMRLLAGFSLAGLFVITESWLNSTATRENRGRVLSLYTIIAVASMGLGQLLLNVAAPEGAELFILVSVLVSLSLVPLSLAPQRTPTVEQPRGISLGELYRASPLGFVGCLTTGVAQGAFFSLAAVYATLVGLDVATTSLFLALPMLGVAVVQMPLGFLSDGHDRRMVLMGLALAVGAVGVVNVFASLAGSAAWQLAAVTVFGSLMVPVYSLSISHMNDNIERDQMLGASAKLVLVYGIGSAAGPFVIGTLMGALGPLAFFWALALLHLVLGLFAVYRMTQRESLPIEAQGDYVMMAPRLTSVGAAAAMQLGEAGAAEDVATGRAPTEPRP